MWQFICQRQFPSSHFLAKLRTKWQDLGNVGPLGNVAHERPSLYMGHVGMAGGNPEAIRMDLSKHPEFSVLSILIVFQVTLW